MPLGSDPQAIKDREKGAGRRETQKGEGEGGRGSPEGRREKKEERREKREKERRGKFQTEEKKRNLNFQAPQVSNPPFIQLFNHSILQATERPSLQASKPATAKGLGGILKVQTISAQ